MFVNICARRLGKDNVVYLKGRNIKEEQEDYEIVVPSLAEIIVPLGLPDQINEREESQLPSSEPITEVGA